MVDAVFDDAVQRVGQFFLIDVVLILADADGSRIDLHKLCQRILHAARDGNGTAQRGVEIWKFLSSQR